MPLAIIPSFDPLMQVRQEGRWSELEGVVHAVNTNGTLTLMGNTGLACLWLGKTRPDQTAGWVDAKLRVRGVLLQHVMDAPLLLIPSLDFVDLEESPPQEPFSIPRIPVAKLLSEKIKAARLHRVRVVGEVTYCDPDSFFIQDESGGVRVQAANKAGIKTGDTLQVLAFPAVNGSTHILAEALVQPIHLAATVLPKNLELHESSASSQNGTLVQADAVLLGQMTNATLQILELQDQLRIFTATLATGHGNLPALTPGSRLLVSGVRGDQMMVTPQPEEKSGSTPFLSSLNILLRQPQDVVVLSGPPWWTWKRTVTLVGMLLLTLAMASLWVHLLRRRLEHQQAARLAFSQHVLGKLEEERKRIASNLHDSLGHTLLVIKNHALLAAQSPSDGQEIQGRMDQISGVTTQAIEEVRRIAQGLRPSQLDRLGLTETLRALVNRASENNSISFASRVEEIDGLFDKDAEIHLFRIVQEAITNIVKHSSSTEAAVVVKKLETAVLLSVRDNGRGFDPAELSARQHSLGYGITGITERVRILKGTLALDSRPGTGTRLIVEIPFKL
jgi:signal transduction histidine kinase